MMQIALLNVVKMGCLFLLLTIMVRGRTSRRLRLWTAALFPMVVNAALPMIELLHDPRVVHVRLMIHVQLFVLTGTLLILSFLVGSASKEKIVSIGLALAIPSWILGYIVAFHPGGRWAIALCVIVAHALALTQTRYISGDPRGPRRVGILLMCVSIGGMILMMLPHHSGRVPDMMIAELLLAAAILSWTTPRRRTGTRSRRSTGMMTTSGGLLLWSLFFPLSLSLDRIMADPTLSNVYWNLPRFLVCFGMLIIVHEEELGWANDLSEKYRLLFDHHPLPMWVFHAETLRFLMVNEAAVTHYGYTQEQFAAMTIADIRPAEDLERLREVVVNQQGELKRTVGWKHTLVDGRLLAAHTFTHPLPPPRQPARIVAALDVTQRNAAEEKLRQAYKLESLGQLTGGVAHDFNNILAIILGSLELVEQRRVLDGPTEQLIRQAVASVHRGSELTGRLLAYARKQPLEPRIVAIPRLLEEMAAFIRSSLGPTITLDVVCDPMVWRAEIDPSQLENALLNLAVNARDAMEESGLLTIRCGNVKFDQPLPGLLGEIGAGEYVMLSVTDNGTGMSAETIQRATEPFFTTKPVGKGTGLGLSMVYGFLKQSGGHMQIESKMRVGTTVSMYLPRAAIWDRRAVPREAGWPADGLQRGEEKILVVEDEHAIRAVLVQVLRSLGYLVLEAEDGPEALGHLEKTPGIALLLTDVVLPNGISGGALAADAKVIQPEIKVIFSSGYTRNALIRDRKLEEGVHLLTKPFRLAELAATVRRVLDTA